MAIDFTLTPELEELRTKVRTFLDDVVVPTEKTRDPDDRDAYLTALLGMRKAAFEAGLWCPHMPEEWGG
ncbi:MAG: acyl-CoA dehydrogenase family protein, partial [Acidimicrobiales bacterium]